MSVDKISPAPKRILLVQLGDLGDVVLTTPTVHSLKHAFPDCELLILVRKPFGDILTNDPALQVILQIEKGKGSSMQKLRQSLRLMCALRQNHFSWAIDLRTGDRGALLTGLSGAALRMGRRSDERPFWHHTLFTTLLTDASPGDETIHPGADQSLRLLRALGINPAVSCPILYTDPSAVLRMQQLLKCHHVLDSPGFITLNPCSRWSYKEWPFSRWSTVIDWLWAQFSIPTVLVGTAAEHEVCGALSDSCSGHCISLAGKTTLPELSALLSLSQLHLGVDSAAPHMASALGIPCLTLHGPTDWRLWRLEKATQGVMHPDHKACIPCNRKGCQDSEISQCLEEFAADSAIAQIQSFLRTVPFFQARRV